MAVSPLVNDRYPHHVVHVTGAFLVEGGPDGSHRDVLVTIDLVVVVIVQVTCKERVLPALQHFLNRLEAF